MSKEPKEELLIEPIIGYREWEIKQGSNYWLNGIGVDYRWHKGVNTFRCFQDAKHKKPKFNCSCGFWAYKDVTKIFDHLFSRLVYVKDIRDLFRSTTNIAGIVKLTGTIIEHEEGYRAEKAEIVELFVGPNLLEEAQKQGIIRGIRMVHDNFEESYHLSIDGNPISLSTPHSSMIEIEFYDGQRYRFDLRYMNNTSHFIISPYGWADDFNMTEIKERLSDIYKVPVLTWKEFLRKHFK